MERLGLLLLRSPQESFLKRLFLSCLSPDMQGIPIEIQGRSEQRF